jgi:ABC-type cobalamin/Fe3+-siderophores transport system ATPase subunit
MRRGVAPSPLHLSRNININQKFTEISDKLAAVYGETKAAIEEKISKLITDTKKKLKSLFFVFGTQETDDEDKKIDEAKRTFELKTFIHKMYKKLKGQEEKEIEKDAH